MLLRNATMKKTQLQNCQFVKYNQIPQKCLYINFDDDFIEKMQMKQKQQNNKLDD